MKQRPWQLTTLSVLFGAISLGFPLQVIGLFDLSGVEVLESWAFLTGFNLLCVGLAGATSLGVWNATRFSRTLIVLTGVALGLNNFSVASSGENFSPELVWLASGLTLIVGLALLHGKGWRVLSDPRLQWWKRLPRAQVAIPAFIDPLEGKYIRTQTYDLNEQGVFLSMDQHSCKGVRVADRVIVCLTMGTLQQLRCQARVVRVQPKEIKGSYPAGFGLAFEDLSSKEKWAIRRFLRTNHTVCSVV